MRIISGQWGGLRLKTVDSDKTRPTTDKVKESIFNMIGPYFTGGQALDVYAGSGGLAIEAVSRGMESAILIDVNKTAIDTINHNIEVTKSVEKFKVLQGDSRRLFSLIKNPSSLVFIDPPYAKQTIVSDIELLMERNLIDDGGIIVCETSKDTVLPDIICKNVILVRTQSYGSTTNVYIYKLKG